MSVSLIYRNICILRTAIPNIYNSLSICILILNDNMPNVIANEDNSKNQDLAHVIYVLSVPNKLVLKSKINLFIFLFVSLISGFY